MTAILDKVATEILKKHGEYSSSLRAAYFHWHAIDAMYGDKCDYQTSQPFAFNNANMARSLDALRNAVPVVDKNELTQSLEYPIASLQEIAQVA